MKKSIEVTVNGKSQSVEVDTRMVLADMLRENLRLTGTHIGCGTGSCGACTVMLDGRTVKSCSVLAADADGRSVQTVEGLSTSAVSLHPVQEAMVENQGLQCGYCTPGMVLSAVELLNKNPDPTEDEIRHGIAGNLCRCTGYHFVVTSIQAAAKSMKEGA
ncbi:MAG: (2Fe-2S)-binding protein [Alphaproteobacteria bacterium]|jgi:carbon-monoxide dehydrogenase small subunit|nr:(2Fe-2S)-binding protein [Alphaproteobacteria bacterium]MDP6816589.1 (2Fe-2S)-binding protein [Alphaproteobacteria bacterium]|tara:strand:+ start:2453 stop:2932 length:480 start_codon:yes stop_codon:yes gene_type:complete